MKNITAYHLQRFFLLGVLATLFFSSTLTLQTQPFRSEINPFEVAESSGDLLLNPFAGGLDLTRIGLMDIDGDGDPDLFAMNISERLRFYRNEGGTLFRREVLTGWESAPLRSWFRLSDIDGDGDADLFTSGERSELLLLRNNGSNLSPLLAEGDTVRQSDGTVIYTEQLTVPTFADIDTDGDLDLFSGNVDGTITYYENVGSREVADFLFRSRKYEGLLVLSPAGTVREKEDRSTASASHGASVLDFVDLDGDLDLDILFGDFFTKKLLHFENRGTQFVPDFDTLWVDSAFAPSGDVVVSVGFNQAVSGDIDKDSDFDVFVSSLLASASDRPVELYINEGTPTAPQMRRRSANPTSEIDVGRFSSPVFFKDSEHHGLLVGSEDGSVTWYEIDESGGRTRMNLSRRFVLNGVTLSALAAGDLDNDGKWEVVVGKGDALDGTTLQLYRFEGDDLLRTPWQLDTTFNIARSSASPTLGDIDNDGDLDLFVGARNGRFYLFRNIGSSTTPIFEVQPPPPPFDTLDLGADAVPRFADIDGDNDLDLIVGSRQSETLDYDTVRFWVNVEGLFREESKWPPMAVARNPVPLYLRLLEGNFLLIGTRPGGLIALADSSGTSSVDRHQLLPSTQSISLTLSPSTGEVVVDWSGVVEEGVEVVVVDILGKEWGRYTLDGNRGNRRIKLEGLSEGVYFWKAGESSTGSFLLVR
ncbi:MAG: FG-GAP repeat domain-containing protein [Candidatus Kapaibacterium sp.]